LDAFGVLNAGGEAIPGAPEVVAELQRLGKTVLVPTNGATQSAADALAKYRGWGYAFASRDVIASRDLLHHALKAWPPNIQWGFDAPEIAALNKLPVANVSLELDAKAYDEADGFVFLSTRAWSHEQQALLHAALLQRPRPLLVANPDIAAPRKEGFSLEQGTLRTCWRSCPALTPASMANHSTMRSKKHSRAWMNGECRLRTASESRWSAIRYIQIFSEALQRAAQQF